jgi:hypothetical protein
VCTRDGLQALRKIEGLTVNNERPIPDVTVRSCRVVEF